jgi:hypothetical protein
MAARDGRWMVAGGTIRSHRRICVEPKGNRPNMAAEHYSLDLGKPQNDNDTEHNRLAVNISFLLAAIAMLSTKAGDMVYFLVGPTSFAPSDLPYDSCILTIPKKQVADIQHARDLIQNLRAPVVGSI